LYNWTTILEVPDVLGNIRSLLEQYGNIDMEDCQIHANDYMMIRQRDAQNSVMLYQFLTNSISNEMKSELTVPSEIYEVQGQFDGICFFETHHIYGASRHHHNCICDPQYIITIRNKKW
jgi:hypothetical protein